MSEDKLMVGSKVLRDNIQGVTKASVRRLARRGGVQRISSKIYETTRLSLRLFLERVIGKAVAILERTDRKTIMTSDVSSILAERKDQE